MLKVLLQKRCLEKFFSQILFGIFSSPKLFHISAFSNVGRGCWDIINIIRKPYVVKGCVLCVIIDDRIYL